MSSGQRKRYCVFGCSIEGAYMHKFPHPKRRSELFKKWVSIVGNKLKQTDPLKIYNNKRVCDYHFTYEEKVASHRLIVSAVPTLYLSDFDKIFKYDKNKRLRGHHLKLRTSFSHNNPHKHFLSNRVVRAWNKLPENVVSAQNVNQFKNRLDKHISIVKKRQLNNDLRDTGVTQEELSAVQFEHNYCFPRILPAVATEEVGSKSSPLPNPPTTHEELLARLEPNMQPSTSRHQHAADVQDLNASVSHALQQQKSRQKQLRKLKTQLRKSKYRELNFKARLHKAEKLLAEDNVFERITRNMSETGKILTGLQHRHARKKPKGRRFTTEEKVLSLSVYKRSPKCYSYLAKQWALPSAKTLKNLLCEIKISPGLNDVIFDQIKETVVGLSKEDRLCTLIFDEMSLTPHVQYNPGKDKFIGFVSNGDELKIANHALVFMVKGIKNSFKQLIAYYFTQTLKTAEMKKIIKDVIDRVHQTGLRVICTVCDQGTTNVSAINGLVADTREKYIKEGKEWREEIFELNGRKIIPLYDVPHLLKGLRNNLLNKDLKYSDENEEKIVKWEYFQRVYEADKLCEELRFLHKITEEHVNPAKIKKMRVKMAAQLFSHSVAVATNHLITTKKVPQDCQQLIPFVLLIDKLFDSLNAGTFHIPNGKIFRGAVRKNSPHHKLWRDAKMFFKNVKFIAQKKIGNKIRSAETTAPSVKIFIKTIEGIEAIWKILHQKYGLDTFLTRNCNQDPIENFFGNIRALGVRNVSPNCSNFEGAFKTLLLNNYSSRRTVNANCEEDFNTCLKTFEFFIRQKSKKDKINEKESQTLQIHENFFETLISQCRNDTSDEALSQYVCGWVLKQCLKKIVKNCQLCRNTLLADSTAKVPDYIRAKEYNQKKQWLCYPSESLIHSFTSIQEITANYLKTNVKVKGTKRDIKNLINTMVTFPFDCKDHEEKLKEYFVNTVINLLIFSWCKSVDRILPGKIQNTDLDDPVKQSAQQYYNTHKTK